MRLLKSAFRGYTPSGAVRDVVVSPALRLATHPPTHSLPSLAEAKRHVAKQNRSINAMPQIDMKHLVLNYAGEQATSTTPP